MKIGIYQPHIIWENKKANIEAFQRVLESNQDTFDLILLPEMSFTGFSMNTVVTGEDNNDTITAVSELSRRFRSTIGFGWVKHKSDCENHYTVVDCEGRVLSDYIKIHPFSYSGENDHFTSGTELSFFELSDICFATLICYDLRFPELFRIASRKADAIIVPANWPEKRNAHWETLIRARAIENQVYMIGINCVGNIGNVEYCGCSCVIAPDGTELMKVKGAEALARIELNNDVQKYREEFPTYRDRKDELYYTIQKEYH